jgi:ferredoxin
MGTPFKIRQTIKSMLGLKSAPAAKADKPKFTLVVLGSKTGEQTTEAPVGHTVLLSAGNLGSPIASGCSDSSCSTCRIDVLAGEQLLSPCTDQEIQTLKANARSAEMRLACLATVVKTGSLSVRAFEFLE